MSRKRADGFPRQRSASLKERLFFVNRDRRNAQSTRARIQSNGAQGDLTGPLTIKYNFIKEMSIRVYTLDTTSRSPWERLKNNTRFPWSWDTYAIVLGQTEIYSPSAVGVFAKPIEYTDILTWTAVSIPHLPFSYIKLCTEKSSLLIQAPDPYQRDGLLHSVQWKINVFKYEKTLYSASQPEVIIEELKSLVKLTLEGPLYLGDTNRTLLDIVSNLLIQNQDIFNMVSNEALITTLAPLFEANQPSVEICNFFTKHCRACPRSRVVIEMFMPVVLRMLKYNMNYGKSLWLRAFVKEYIQALSMQNDGEAVVRAFVQTIHGPLSICPHKRILNNLFAVCPSAIYESFMPPGEKSEKSKRLVSLYKKNSSCKNFNDENQDPESPDDNPNMNELWNVSIAKYSKNITESHNNNALCSTDSSTPRSEPSYRDFHSNKDQKPTNQDWKPDIETAVLFAKVLDEISTINDWLPGLAVLIQPVPFQAEAIQEKEIMKYIVQILDRIIESKNDDALWCLVSVRDHKDGWLQMFSPQNNIYEDEGVFFTKMVAALLESAKRLSKVKKLVTILMKTCLNAALLLAFRDSKVMIEVLVFALEYKVAVGQEEVQIVSTLRSTTSGIDQYERLCEQQKVMRQTGGPGEFTLPPRSTDKDLHKFLSSGSCGNLKDLNLSFTYVTCKSADIISRLPVLQHLNLWSTGIQDLGLRRLCESLNLNTLNLCETNVTDDSIMCLKDMTNLTDLNLNSTGITDGVFQELRQSLPNLAHCDISYTDADAYPQTDGSQSELKQNNAASSSPSKPIKLEYTQNV